MQEINGLVFHHSASPLDTSVADVRKWHVTENGWKDIGYHGIVTSDGVYHACRPIPTVGAHCKGSNFDTIGICAIGNNTKSDHSWTDLQIEALHYLKRIIRTLWPDAWVLGHRDVAGTGTECPGLSIRELLGD